MRVQTRLVETTLNESLIYVMAKRALPSQDAEVKKIAEPLGFVFQGSSAQGMNVSMRFLSTSSGSVAALKQALKQYLGTNLQYVGTL